MSKQPTAPTHTTPSNCPRCGSSNIRRSKTQASDPWHSRLFAAHYRCRNCRVRFRVRKQRRFYKLAAVAVAGTMLSAALGGALLGLQRHSMRENAVSQLRTAEILALKQRVSNGDTGAEAILGLIYLLDPGDPDNPAHAARWFEKAANHGDKEGAYHYGMALLTGQGVAINRQQALRWLEKSARAGHVRAQYQLGNFYRDRPERLESNSKAAYLWYTLAALQGSQEADAARNAVAARLSAQSVEEIQQQAKQMLADQ